MLRNFFMGILFLESFKTLRNVIDGRHVIVEME